MFVNPVEVKPLPDYRLWIKYSDGMEGEVDLSYLTGQGVFSIWNDRNVFNNVRFKNDSIIWNDEVDICADSLYMRITGKTPEECFPSLRKDSYYA